MNIDEAVLVTQERLSQEGYSMRDLLEHFRDRISLILIGEQHWKHILKCAEKLPIEMGALPFGFEIPVHDNKPVADFGVSLASGTRTALFYEELAHAENVSETTKAILHLFRLMESENPKLRDIVGRKLMLEFDIDTESGLSSSIPGMFLRPGERPIIGCAGQVCDVRTVANALQACVGWAPSAAERRNIKLAYLAQPADTRTDSFGIFPARSRSIRLAVMGFKTPISLRKYLEDTSWPGEISAVESIVERFRKRAQIIKTGINIDIQEAGLGPTLGLTLIVKQRYTKDSRYWLDGLTEWDPFLRALGHEDIVINKKLEELRTWNSKPTVLFAKSGRFVLLRGIHHIKLVICNNRLQKVKAYLFLVLSGAISL